MTPTPVRQEQEILVTPLVRDLIVKETQDTTRVDVPDYGTRHPNRSKYPHHKFCHAEVSEAQGLLHDFYYIAEREDQDLYNFEHQPSLAFTSASDPPM